MNSSQHQPIYRGRLEGSFTGFDSDALFKLDNDTFWLQAEYKYWYYYAYCPEVQLFVYRNATFLQPIDCSESVAVTQIFSVVESQIVGEFHGWGGESEYELTNGQVWQEARYRYQYKYKYRPRVLIYDGMGGKVMDVDGSRAVVSRIR